MHLLSFKHGRQIIAAVAIGAITALTIGAVYQQPLSSRTQPPAPQVTPVPVASFDADEP
jgi:hypothetical protein